MKKSLSAFLLFTFQFFIGSAQNVGIGTITPKAKLEIVSSNSGILIPRLTTTARNAISNPPKGLLVYDSTAKQFYYHDGTGWQSMSASASSFWQQNGIAGNEIKNTNAGGFWSAAITGLNINSNNTTNPSVAPVNGAGTRLMWIPSRSAFRAGTVNDVYGNESKYWDKDSIGLFSFATGFNTKAIKEFSFAAGAFTVASGTSSTAMGYGSKANEFASTAMGNSAIASGNSSTAMGFGAIATGIYSTAMGYITLASGSNSSTAMGFKTTAAGNSSTAMGFYSVASGNNSTAIGNSTTASAENSTATGLRTKASGENSIAMGDYTTASGIGSTAMGDYTTASGSYSTAMGTGSTASENAATAMGYVATASGIRSTAIGFYTTASGYASVAMGQYTTASGDGSTAMGSYGNTNSHTGSFIIHDNIDENVDGITRNSLDNQMIMKFDGGFGFYSGDASAPSMGFEKTQGLSVFGSNIRAVSGIVSANGVTLTSDKRFKNTITGIQYGLNTIMQLRPVSYLWNTDRVHNNNALKGTQLGFVAQEVEQVIPSAVLTDTDSLQSKSIKYMEIIPVLTKAIQEQQAQIEILQKQNDVLVKRIQKLERNEAAK